MAVLRAITLSVFFIALGSTTAAKAAGLMLYESGAPDLGTASAGRAALASDASTASSNPAGMTLLDRTQLMVAAGVIIPVINFDRGAETSVRGGGGGGGNVGVPLPLGGFFYVYSLSDRLRLGFNALSNLGSRPITESSGSGVTMLSEPRSSPANPSLAHRVNEWLSVGAGFSFAVGRLYDEAKINNALPRVQDGGLEIESWDEAFGGNVGFLLRPLSKLRIGLTYSSPVDFKFGFHPHITGLGPGLEAGSRRSGFLGAKINLVVTEPQQMMASLSTT